MTVRKQFSRRFLSNILLPKISTAQDYQHNGLETETRDELISALFSTGSKPRTFSNRQRAAALEGKTHQLPDGRALVDPAARRQEMEKDEIHSFPVL